MENVLFFIQAYSMKVFYIFANAAGSRTAVLLDAVATAVESKVGAVFAAPATIAPATAEGVTLYILTKSACLTAPRSS